MFAQLLSICLSVCPVLSLTSKNNQERKKGSSCSKTNGETVGIDSSRRKPRGIENKIKIFPPSLPTFSSSSFLPLTYDGHALSMLCGTAAAG